MVQRSGWLLDSLPRIFDSKHLIWIVTLVSVLIVLPTPATGNQCLVGGVYINVTVNETTIVNAPENGTLQDVGNKTCGFHISGRIVDGSCQKKYTMQFVAIDVEEGEPPFCNFWGKQAICVCNFFGCNSVTGVLYETLLKSLGKNGKVKGEDYSSASGFYQRDSLADIATDCILDRIQDAYINKTTPFGARNEAVVIRQFAEWKQNNPGLFPDPKAVEKMLKKKDEIEKTTQTPSGPSKPSEQPNKPSETTPTDSDSAYSNHVYCLSVLISALFTRQFV